MIPHCEERAIITNSRFQSRRRRTEMLLVSVAASAAVASIGTGVAHGSFPVTERFNNDTDAYWQAVDNRAAPQNYGWSNMDNTGVTVNPPGGTASGAGEFGGQIYRPQLPATPTYYGFDIGTINPATEGFSVSGVIRSNREDGALFLGYFQGAFSFPDPNKNAHNFVGFLLNDGTDVFTQVYNPNGSREGVQLPGVVVPTDGTPVPFSMVYEAPPAGIGNGALTVSVAGASGTTNLPNNIVQSIGDLTHFGLFPQVKDPGTASFSEVYLDDLTFSSENEIPIPSGSVWAVDNGGDWSAATNWTGGVPNAIGASATFGDIITADRLIIADIPVTVGNLIFDNNDMYEIDGVGSLTLQVASGLAQVEVEQGAHQLNLPVVIASDTTLDVAPGTLRVSDPITVNAGVDVTQTGGGSVLYESTVNVLNGGSVQFANSSHMAGLTLAAAATATITQSGNRALKVDNLSITPGKLDLKDNKLIVTTPGATGTWTGTGYDGISGLVDVARGEAGNAMWDGATGITTSDSRAAMNGDLVSIGVAKVSEVRSVGDGETTSFAGYTVSGSDTLAMVTWGGDANLDGKINIDDYGRIDGNVGQSGSVFGWSRGDFNYDGKINIDDYGIIDGNINRQGLPFSTAAEAVGAVATVPEPVSLLIVAIPAVLSRPRKRR